VVGGEHPVPEEEEEFVGRVEGEVGGGGTVLEEDHYRRRGMRRRDTALRGDEGVSGP